MDRLCLGLGLKNKSFKVKTAILLIARAGLEICDFLLDLIRYLVGYRRGDKTRISLVLLVLFILVSFVYLGYGIVDLVCRYHSQVLGWKDTSIKWAFMCRVKFYGLQSSGRQTNRVTKCWTTGRHVLVNWATRADIDFSAFLKCFWNVGYCNWFKLKVCAFCFVLLLYLEQINSL